MNVIFRKIVKSTLVKNLKKDFANRSNSLSAQDLSIGFPKHKKNYESPSSRRDILIFVWTIFENFRKSPDFRHTFPRFWARNCPDNRKFLENVLKSKWNFWSHGEGFNAIVSGFCIYKVNTFFVGQKILFFRFFDFFIFLCYFFCLSIILYLE